jgi:hypothetical protein
MYNLYKDSSCSWLARSVDNVARCHTDPLAHQQGASRQEISMNFEGRKGEGGTDRAFIPPRRMRHHRMA